MDFSVKAMILKLIEATVDDDGTPYYGADTDIELEINGIRLRGFLPNAMGKYKQWDAAIGSKIAVVPYLSLATPWKTTHKTKEVRSGLAGDAYVIGRVKRLFKDNGRIRYLLVDCGFDLLVENETTYGPNGRQARNDFEIGDYVDSQGRLDFFLPSEFTKLRAQ